MCQSEPRASPSGKYDQVVNDRHVIQSLLRTALAARSDPDTFIIGRTDAYGPLGLDEAIRRAGRFLDAGVDGVFVAGLTKEAEYETVGRALEGAVLSAAMFGGGATPWLTPAELGDMGYRHVSFPALLISAATLAVGTSLAELRRHASGGAPMGRPHAVDAARHTLDDAVNLQKWNALSS